MKGPGLHKFQWETGNPRRPTICLLVHTLVPEQVDSLYGVAISPDGTRVVAGGRDGALYGWQLDETGASATVTAEAAGHHNAVRATQYSPDGALLLCARFDGYAAIVDAESQRLVRKLGTPLQGHRSLAWPSLDIVVLGGGVLGIEHRDAATGRVSKAFAADGDEPIALDSAGRRLLVAGGSKKTVSIRTAWDNGLVRTLSGHTAYVQSAIFDPEGERILSSSTAEAIVWNAETGAPIHRFEGVHSEDLAVSESGKLKRQQVLDEIVFLLAG